MFIEISFCTQTHRCSQREKKKRITILSRIYLEIFEILTNNVIIFLNFKLFFFFKFKLTIVNCVDPHGYVTDNIIYKFYSTLYRVLD